MKLVTKNEKTLISDNVPYTYVAEMSSFRAIAE
jgi:hypothetical protein